MSCMHGGFAHGHQNVPCRWPSILGELHVLLLKTLDMSGSSVKFHAVGRGALRKALALLQSRRLKRRRIISSELTPCCPKQSSHTGGVIGVARQLASETIATRLCSHLRTTTAKQRKTFTMQNQPFVEVSFEFREAVFISDHRAGETETAVLTQAKLKWHQGISDAVTFTTLCKLKYKRDPRDSLQRLCDELTMTRLYHYISFYTAMVSAHSWVGCTNQDNEKILEWMKANATMYKSPGDLYVDTL